MTKRAGKARFSCLDTRNSVLETRYSYGRVIFSGFTNLSNSSPER
jgi:hypothetical protein